MSLTRRDLIRYLAGAAALVKLPLLSGCGDNADADFTSTQLATLNGFADVILPPDDQPGASDLGVHDYIENLLAAFKYGPPQIYASGPFSGRTPNADGTFPDNDFANFIELDRVSYAAWQLTVLGSAAVPGGGPNEALVGATVALRDQLRNGLDAAVMNVRGTPDYQVIYDALDPDFQQLVFDLVTQACWCAPEYGGNPDLAGWKMVHFEGDSLPRGYSQYNGSGYDELAESPMSTPNPSDPEPLTADVEQMLSTVANVLGGRDNS